MRLTRYTDYALRLLMYLAVKQDGLATVAEVADSYGISKNHMMKVAHQLGVAGYVEAVRGCSGGLRLARPAEEISVGEVVRRTEQDMILVPCLQEGDTSCVIRPCCMLKSALAQAASAFLVVLDGYSLGDLVQPRGALTKLLAIDAVPRQRVRGERAGV